jgi:predicted amidophosphoribosyltransferase
MMLKIHVQKLIKILFTPRCVLCGGDLIDGALCKFCAALCNAYPPHSFNTQKSEYGALFYYEFSIRNLIKQAKFFRGISQSQALIVLINEALDRSTVVDKLREFKADAVTYVPSQELKRIMRGIDLPSMFASLLAQRLRVPVRSLLKKKRWSQSLSLVTNRVERQKAVDGTLSLLDENCTFERLVIVDDIYTTGATFDESRKVLKSSCKECRCLAIARTP